VTVVASAHECGAERSTSRAQFGSPLVIFEPDEDLRSRRYCGVDGDDDIADEPRAAGVGGDCVEQSEPCDRPVGSDVLVAEQLKASADPEHSCTGRCRGGQCVTMALQVGATCTLVAVLTATDVDQVG